MPGAAHRGPLPTFARTIVVGAGLAGLELVDELARQGGDDILLIEAGGADDLRHVNVAHDPRTALRLWLDSRTDPTFTRPWKSLTPPHYGGSSGVRRRLGGRGLYWYGVTLSIEPWALAEPWWPRAVVRDLTESWRGGPSLYERVGERLHTWTHRYVPGSVPAPRPAETHIGALRLRPTPMARRLASDGGWYAYSALDDWRDPLTGTWRAAPRGVRLLTGTEATQVLVRDGRACGVSVERRDGAPQEIAAEQVVLCAGTLQSSGLALQALHDAGADGPVELHGLADHIVQGVFLRLADEHAQRLHQVLPTGSYYTPCAPGARSNLFVDVHGEEPDGSVVVEIRAMGEQLDQDTSRVSCTPGERRPWPLAVHSRPSDADRILLRAQREAITECYRQLCGAVGLTVRALDFADYEDPERGNDFALPENLVTARPGEPVTWCNQLGTEDHEGGTLPLGGVLDDRHEFRAVPGLYAAGPATFPRLGAANPTLTTLALAHRLAALLAERAGSTTRQNRSR